MILFASDIHGSVEALRLLTQRIEELNPEQIVLLGDYLYHGPRNPLLDDYAPKAAADLLNAQKSRILAVRGNCDSEVDQLLLEFPIEAPYAMLLVDGRRFFLTHGHHWNGDYPPPIGTADVLCHGHTHLPLAVVSSCGLFCFNPGSISLPKGGNPPTFGTYEAGKFSIRLLKDSSVFLQKDLQ